MGVFSVFSFAGGMNDAVNPQLLEPNVGPLFYNCDISDGKIRGVRDLKYNGPKTPEQLGHHGNRDRSLVKWFDRTYWSDNTTKVAPWFGGDKETLGVEFPKQEPSLSLVPDSQGLTGTYKYAVTFVNSNGWESSPGNYDSYYSVIEVTDKKVKVQCEAFPETIKYAKVYRTIDKGADFYLVGKIETTGGELIDDTKDDVLLLGEKLVSFDHFPPPDAGRFICEAQGTFFLAVGSRLFFSVNGNPHAWPPLNFIGMDDTITGICREQQGILVFTRNNAYQVVGITSPDTITKNSIPGNQGCVSFRSLCSVNNNPIWLSNDGICVWDGSNIHIITKNRLNIKSLSVTWAVSANDVYYLMFKDEIIAYNLRLGGVFYKLKFTYFMHYAWYDVDIDTLFFVINNAVYRFGAGKVMEFEYHSPMIGKTYLVNKKFHDIFISCTEPAMVTANIDGKDILTVNVKAGREKIKLPLKIIGYDLFLKIKSKGVLNEFSVSYE